MVNRVCPPAVGRAPGAGRAARGAGPGRPRGLLLVPVPPPPPRPRRRPPLTGLALGRTGCRPAWPSSRRSGAGRLAQRLMVGVDGSDPDGTAQTSAAPRWAGSHRRQRDRPAAQPVAARGARDGPHPAGGGRRRRGRPGAAHRRAGRHAAQRPDDEPARPAAGARAGPGPGPRAGRLRDHHQLRADRGRQPAAQRRSDRRPLLRQRPGAGRPVRRRLRPGPARGRGVHRAQALPRARARRRRLAPRAGQHATTGPAAPRRPASLRGAGRTGRSAGRRRGRRPHRGDGRAPRRPRADHRPAQLAHPGGLRAAARGLRFDGVVFTRRPGRDEGRDRPLRPPGGGRAGAGRGRGRGPVVDRGRVDRCSTGWTRRCPPAAWTAPPTTRRPLASWRQGRLLSRS